ncbi:MAG: tyrosine-protein phosphatase [Nocardioides sp.]
MSTEDAAQLSEDFTRLASADNFRDVVGDGYPTGDGGRLRTGVLFRSNELQLSDEDGASLQRLGITHIFDLRDDHEVEAHPDMVVPGTTWRHLEVKGIAPGAGAELPDAETTRATLLAIYRRFVNDPAARASFGTLLAELAAGTTPQLFHCTAGKDRTGWTAALILHVAGADAATIDADYLLTNERSYGTRQKYLGLVAEHLGPDRVEVFEPMMVADLDYLRAAIDEAHTLYGGIDGYLRDGLGLSDDQLASLKDRLTA